MRILLILATAIGFCNGAALAQTAPGAAGSNQVIPEQDQACPGSQPKNGRPLASGRSGSLSDKLDKSGGVIKPKPGVDPGIEQAPPVPNPNSTPVIRPPGAPGGLPGPEAK